MPPGIYAPATATPSSKLKAMKGPGAAGGITPGAPMFGGVPPPATSTVRPNPTQMQTIGGATQQTDQMGRVITSSMGGPAANGGLGSIDPSTGMLSQSYGRAPSSITIEDPDQVRRSRDLADEQTRLSMYQPRPAAGPGPGASPNPGIDPSEIPGLLDQFKPDAVPREPGITAPPREQGKGPEDRRAAESAAFARAAERIASIGKGNLAGLRNQMTRRGISGSGIEAAGIRDVQNNTAGQLGEVVRDQAIEGLRREQEIDDRDLAANVSQRSQDIGVLGTNYSGGVSQRGQDIGQADWKLQALPSILALLRMKSGAA